MGVSALAQQALQGGPSTESPVINPDGTVTFRYRAPKAVKVTLSGDFLPVQKMEFEMNGQKVSFEQPGVAELKEGQNGVWEYTPSRWPRNCIRTHSPWTATRPWT